MLVPSVWYGDAVPPALPDDPAWRHPQNVAEAREWGFHVPAAENKKDLAWWWVYDPTARETREQREARYLTDDRVVDMRGFARVICRAYATVKELKSEADTIRSVLDSPRHLDQLARTFTEYNSGLTFERAREGLLARAREEVLTAMPPRMFRAGQSDVWTVSAAARFGRETGQLDAWYEYARRPPGRRRRRGTTRVGDVPPGLCNWA